MVASLLSAFLEADDVLAVAAPADPPIPCPSLHAGYQVGKVKSTVFRVTSNPGRIADNHRPNECLSHKFRRVENGCALIDGGDPPHDFCAIVIAGPPF